MDLKIKTIAIKQGYDIEHYILDNEILINWIFSKLDLNWLEFWYKTFVDLDFSLLSEYERQLEHLFLATYRIFINRHISLSNEYLISFTHLEEDKHDLHLINLNGNDYNKLYSDSLLILFKNLK
jgi:hypothetical protein